MRVAVFLALVASASAQVSFDTIGWTDRDHQMYGPAVRYISNDTLRGIHAVWKDSLGAICYNFRPRGADWRWPDGIRASPYNRNLGSMDIDPASGVACIGFDFIFRTEPWSAYYEDSAAGAGRFREHVMSRNHRHVITACGRYGSPEFASMRSDTAFCVSLFTFQRLGHEGPFPAHNISGARRSGRYAVTWFPVEGSNSCQLFMKETPNSGFQWFETVGLSDSIPAAFDHTLTGANALYDSIRLYVIADFFDGQDRSRSELWFYAKYDTPPWHLVTAHSVADPARLGDVALPCSRPSIARSLRTSDLFAVWEQFDDANIEPSTGLYRASVWAARSQDSGATWGTPLRLTQPDQRSWRFPFIADPISDSLRIICFPDSVAGYWEQGQGPRALNPVIMLSLSADDLPVAVKEPLAAPDLRTSTLPTLAASLDPRFLLYDALGRRAAAPLRPGVYYARSGATLCRLTLIR